MFRFLAVKVPSLIDEEMTDVAAYLGARFINADTKVGDPLDKVKFSDLGFAKRVVAGEEETILIGGRGTELHCADEDKLMTLVEARLAQLKETLDHAEHDELFRAKLQLASCPR